VGDHAQFSEIVVRVYRRHRSGDTLAEGLEQADILVLSTGSARSWHHEEERGHKMS
jgi:cysteine sulfinate desulfinase/cysteine desulfurase-like protein